MASDPDRDFNSGLTASKFNALPTTGYIDRTSDVQTAALVLLFTGCVNSSNEERDIAYRIVDSYYSLLNSWRLWHTRARLENIARKNGLSNSSVKNAEFLPQIYLTCSFCGKPACGPPDRQRQKQKLGSCLNCKKPLPRCTLCGLHLGTQLVSCYDASGKSNKFGSWFAWCQACRHGGHTEHLATWFEVLHTYFWTVLDQCIL
ncbi:unnamed protein product [Soboliphyme baturini]|uniref:Zinc_ribbon_16 domain-containing protein n=1 Tax=Soboliphyme baturini TaxID=241478 RepID=A0A183IVG8_9BILA|nr:unnamed protein product [Soboliphyme baturini]